MWRDQVYQRIKDMTPEEECDYFNARGLELSKKYGFKFNCPPRYSKAAV
jgi:hypothetical protein